MVSLALRCDFSHMSPASEEKQLPDSAGGLQVLFLGELRPCSHSFGEQNVLFPWS